MTIRDIIGPANPILRKKARTVGDPNTPDIQRLVDDMIETMRAAPGVGLAAPQVAVGQRIAVIEYTEPAPDASPDGVSQASAPPKLYVIVNPEIVSVSEEMVNGSEGCLSLPGIWGDVMRHEAVTVKALNRKGRPVKIKARDRKSTRLNSS